MADPQREPTVTNVTDDVYLWVEQGTSIHLKVVTPHGDPVELTEHDARTLAHALLRMVAELERDE